MKDLIEKSKIIICVGTGGVGKTTTSAAIGALAAQMGKKVLILTIDPAQRLKQTLQLRGYDYSPLHHPKFKGQFEGSLIDAQKVFDDFVSKASTKSEQIEKIKKNHLYQQMTTHLSGSQEFSSLEKLYSCFEENRFDLIVLDTPPAQHAIDFLNAPQKLAALFNDNIARWFRQTGGEKTGFLQNILSSGTDQVIKALERLTGSAFMSELADFFRSIQDWQGALEKRIQEMHKMLVSPTTSFVLVTTFEEDKVREAQKFLREIQKGGYQLRSIIINRAYPVGLQFDANTDVQTPRADLYRSYQSWLRSREQGFLELSRLVGKNIDLLQLPELAKSVSDLDSVVELSDKLSEARKT
jgi:anion-transporting  ArsA/GET3 family ATPase